MSLLHLRFDGDWWVAMGHSLNESVESTGMAVLLNNMSSTAHKGHHFC